MNTTARVAPSTRRYYQSSRSHNCKLALLGATLALAVGSAAQESIHHVSLSKANSGKLREEARRLLREARHSIPSLDSQLGDGSTIVDRQLRAQDFNSVLSGVESLQPISWRVYDRRWQFAAGPFGAILPPSDLDVRMGRRNRLYLAMVEAGDRMALRRACAIALTDPIPRMRTADLSSIVWSLAQVGDVKDAIAAADAIVIDDSDWENRGERALARAAIAQAQSKSGQESLARQTLEALKLEGLSSKGLICVAEARATFDREGAALGFQRAGQACIAEARALPENPSGRYYRSILPADYMDSRIFFPRLHQVVTSQQRSGDAAGARATLRSVLVSAYPNANHDYGIEAGQEEYALGDYEEAGLTFGIVREHEATNLHEPRPMLVGQVAAPRPEFRLPIPPPADPHERILLCDLDLQRLVWAELAVGDVNGAKKTCRRAYRLFREDPRAYNGSTKLGLGSAVEEPWLRGVIVSATRQAQGGDHKGACQRLQQQADNLKEPQGSAERNRKLLQLWDCQQEIGDTVGATKTLHQLNLAFKDVDARRNLAGALVRTMLSKGEFKEARAIAQEPDNALLDSSELKQAYYFAFYSQLAHSEPFPPFVAVSLNRWDPSRALAITRFAPNDEIRANSYEGLARAHLSRGERQAALKAVRLALELASSSKQIPNVGECAVSIAAMVHRLPEAKEERARLIRLLRQVRNGAPPDNVSGFVGTADVPPNFTFEGCHLLPRLIEALFDAGQVDEAIKLSVPFQGFDLLWVLRMQAAAGDEAGALHRAQLAETPGGLCFQAFVADGLLDRADQMDRLSRNTKTPDRNHS